LLKRRLLLEETKLQEGGNFLMEENSCKGKEIPENQEIDKGEELLIGGKSL
jgi:hypothetical protein